MKEGGQTGFGPPREFRADVSGNSVYLTWKSNLNPDLEGYNLYLGTSPDQMTGPVPVGNTTSKAFSNVPKGVYYLAVAADDGPKSRTIRVKVAGATDTFPENPAEFTVYRSGQSVLLSWDPNSESDISGYRLHLSASPTDAGSAISLGKRISKEYTVSALSSDLWVSLSAINNAGKQGPRTAPVLVGASNQYLWNTTSVSSRGVYYIYAEITDGKNTIRRYSDLPVNLR